jgi:large subunit ribosomal protein L24
MPARSIEHRTTVPEIRRGDTVLVLTGKDAGKRGVVERVIRKDPSPTPVRSVFRRGSLRGGVGVVVEGLNIAKRHTKPRQRSSGGPGQMPQVDRGGIIDVPAPMPISRVMLVCSHCDKPTRIAHHTLENGKRVRVCRHCGEQLEGTAS